MQTKISCPVKNRLNHSRGLTNYIMRNRAFYRFYEKLNDFNLVGNHETRKPQRILKLNNTLHLMDKTCNFIIQTDLRIK